MFSVLNISKSTTKKKVLPISHYNTIGGGGGKQDTQDLD